MEDVEVIAIVGCFVGFIIILSIVVYVFYKYKTRDRGADLERVPLRSSQQADPKSNSNQSVVDKAELENIILIAKVYLRSTTYTDLQPLPDVNSRKGKYYFTVKDPKDKQTYVMVFTNTLKESLITEENKNRYFDIFSSIAAVKNPFIEPCVKVDYLPARKMWISVRKERKSLKDIIHNAKPQDKYFKKYSTTSGTPLPEDKIYKYAKQIVEGLNYLKTQKIPYYHLQTSNVFVDNNNVCKLSDFENDLIGLSPKLKLFCSKYYDIVDPIVIEFATILFEMSTGYELDTPHLDYIPPGIPSKIKKVLSSIFSKNPEIRTLNDLSNINFITDTKLYNEWVPQNIKIDNKIIDSLILCENTSKQRVMPKSKKPTKRTSTVSNTTTTTSASVSIAKKPDQKNVSSSITSSSMSMSIPEIVSNPPVPPPLPPSSNSNPGRSSLLTSIESFSPKALNKVKTNDRSGPSL